LILLPLVGGLAVLLGFVTLTTDQSLRAMIYGGYWMMLLLTVLFGWNLWQLARTDWPGWTAWRAAPRWPAALITVCGGLLLVHETYGFKILMDEIMLLGTSMSLHFDKLALVPMRGHDLTGAFEVLNGQLDKRPLFQPFLVSLLHDLTGYRPENVFLLNTGLTFLLLALAYQAGRRIGDRAAGAVVVLLLTSLPLLAQNATGGGFEVLNLVMLLAALLLGIRFALQPDGHALNAFLLSGILLALTRYESVVFLFPVALVVAWVGWRARRLHLTWTALASPLYLLPYAWQHQVFAARPGAWELASRPGSERVFSATYLPDNLGHALNFFFNTTGEHSNSLVLAALGFVALPFLLLWLLKALRQLRSLPPARAVFAFFILGLLAHTLLLLCYFWGRFDDPVIRRLSLPLNLLLAFSVVAVAAEFRFPPRAWRVLAAGVVAGLFGHSLPIMARHDYTLDYYVGREMAWRREFIAAHPERDYLVIDNNSIIWITHLVSSTPIPQVLMNKERIIFNLRNRLFTSIYVFQRLEVDPLTGTATVPGEDQLGPDFQLETVWERRFTPLKLSRISRIVTIREGPTTRPAPATDPVTTLPPEELERARQGFFEQLIQRLP